MTKCESIKNSVHDDDILVRSPKLSNVERGRLIKMMKYLVQQPRTLESMALEELGDWISSQAEQMMSSIAELQQRDAAGAEAALSQQIDAIRNRLECNVPRVLQDKLAEEAIQAFDNLLEDTAEYLKLGDCWESYSRINVIGRMIETLFTKHLTRLKLDFRTLNHIEMFLPTLLTKSDMLGGLNQLEIILNQTIDISLVLKDLHDLKHLSLGFFLYTPKALKCIAENCKLVKELQLVCDFEEEMDVVILVHDMLVPLTQLPNLRSIDICGHVGSTAIQALLLSCPNIEHFEISTYHSRETYETTPKPDAIARALQDIMSTQQNAGKQFQLKTYKLYEGTTLEQLQLVGQMCPLIEKMSLTRWYRQQTPIPPKMVGIVINKLSNLRVVELRGYYFHDSKVKDILQVNNGSCLVELRLYDVNQINLDALIFISQMFPNLECFYIHSYIETYEYNLAEFNEETDRLKIPPFRNLKKLTFYGWCKERLIEGTRQLAFFILLNCLNVEFITIASNILTDDVMLEVLDQNPLIYLKELRIEIVFQTWVYQRNSELSMFVIDMIIENCIHPPLVLTELNKRESEISDCESEMS